MVESNQNLVVFTFFSPCTCKNKTYLISKRWTKQNKSWKAAPKNFRISGSGRGFNLISPSFSSGNATVNIKFESVSPCFNPLNVINEVYTSSAIRTLDFVESSVTRISLISFAGNPYSDIICHSLPERI